MVFGAIHEIKMHSTNANLFGYFKNRNLSIKIITYPFFFCLFLFYFKVNLNLLFSFSIVFSVTTVTPLLWSITFWFTGSPYYFLHQIRKMQQQQKGAGLGEEAGWGWSLSVIDSNTEVLASRSELHCFWRGATGVFKEGRGFCTRATEHEVKLLKWRGTWPITKFDFTTSFQPLGGSKHTVWFQEFKKFIIKF